MTLNEALGRQRLVVGLLGMVSAGLYVDDAISFANIGAYAWMVWAYLVFAVVQVIASAALLTGASFARLLSFIATFSFVSVWDVLMLQPVQSFLDYLGVLAWALSLEMGAYALWKLKRSRR